MRSGSRMIRPGRPRRSRHLRGRLHHVAIGSIAAASSREPGPPWVPWPSRAGPRSPAADAPATADELTAKAAAFLKSRQKADGSWSSERGPGITGLVVTALLRSKRATPAEPAIAKGLAYLEGFISPKSGGLAEGPQLELRHLDRPDGLPRGQRRRQVRRPDQGRPGVPQDPPVGRGREQGAGRPLSTAAPGTAAGAGPTCPTPRSSWRPSATPACPPTTPTSRRPWCSSRGARTSRASSTTSPGPARSTTAASSTPRPPAA